MENILKGMTIEEIDIIFSEFKENMNRKWVEHSSVGIEAFTLANFSMLIDEKNDFGIAVCISEYIDDYVFDESTGKMKMTLIYCVGEIRDYSIAVECGDFEDMFLPKYCIKVNWSKDFVISGREDDYVYDGTQTYRELYDVLNSMRIGGDEFLKF